MNTRNSLEERIIEDFRTLSEELRNKFLILIKNLKGNCHRCQQAFSRRSNTISQTTIVDFPSTVGLLFFVE